MFTQIRTAFRKNLLPGVVLWVFGMSLIGMYFYVAPVRSVLEHAARLKETYSFLFSAISMGVFAGLIPSIVAISMRRIPRYRRYKDTIFYTLFWAYKGMEIDLLYRIQVHLFGSGSDFMTLTYKTMVDQFIYVPVIATLPLLVLYRWKELDYTLAATLVSVRTKDFWRQVPIVTISCWLVWVPAVYMIYWFPSALQLAIANLIECFWALLLILLTGTNVQEEAC